MEKSPLHKFNKIRKVTSAAIHMASMDPTHSALKPEDHTANINKKPEIEVTQVQQNPSTSQSALDEQLKKGVQEYLKNEKDSA